MMKKEERDLDICHALNRLFLHSLLSCLLSFSFYSLPLQFCHLPACLYLSVSLSSSSSSSCSDLYQLYHVPFLCFSSGSLHSLCLCRFACCVDHSSVFCFLFLSLSLLLLVVVVVIVPSVTGDTCWTDPSQPCSTQEPVSE